MTDFDSPEMQRALAADQEKIEALMQGEFERRMVLLKGTAKLMAIAVAKGLQNAVDAEVIEDYQAEYLREEFSRETQDALVDLFDHALAKVQEAQQASIISL